MTILQLKNKVKLALMMGPLDAFEQRLDLVFSNFEKFLTRELNYLASFNKVKMKCTCGKTLQTKNKVAQELEYVLESLKRKEKQNEQNI